MTNGVILKTPPGGKGYRCHCCKRELPCCWNCHRGFRIRLECFQENKWSLPNGPTWVCPGCGRIRML